MSLDPRAESLVPQSRSRYLGPLHVLDLPQLHQKPSASSLLTQLSQLVLQPSSWDADNSDSSNPPSVDEEGIPAYLTRIVMSPLDWIAFDDEREEIWEAASKRLAERSGRTAMPSVSRIFQVPRLFSCNGGPGTIDIKIHEPSLTGDNLGHKTWVASYLLAKRLPNLITSQFSCTCTRCRPPTAPRDIDRIQQTGSSPPFSSPHGDMRPRILELGAGTGLVGIAASALCSAKVHLTDLPAILPNLQHNIQENAALSSQSQSTVTASVMDWSLPHPTLAEEDKYDIILAADSLYAPEHAKWLASTMSAYLRYSTTSSQIFVELPFRSPQPPEHEQFGCGMSSKGFQLVEEGAETGFDDWESNTSGERAEVKCWWSVWKWRQSSE